MDFQENENVQLTGAEIVLAGIGEDEDLMGAMGANPKLAAMATSLYRKHFIERIKDFPKWVERGLLDGSLQLSDVVIFGTRDIGADTTVKVFKTDDNIAVGITNIAQACLPEDRPMTLSAIQILHSSAVGSAFTPIAYTDDFSRGEFDLRYNSQNVIEKMPLMGTFSPGVAGYNINKEYGKYELTNPKVLIGGQGKKIESTLTFPAALTDTTTAAKVLFYGVTVVPYSKPSKG